MGDPGVVLGIGPDVEVSAERPGDLVGDELTDRLAGDPPNELALEVALGDGVVPGCSPRLPPRRLGGEQRRRLIPVVQYVDRDRLAPTR